MGLFYFFAHGRKFFLFCLFNRMKQVRRDRLHMAPFMGSSELNS
jgi:hypothetical protein